MIVSAEGAIPVVNKVITEKEPVRSGKISAGGGARQGVALHGHLSVGFHPRRPVAHGTTGPERRPAAIPVRRHESGGVGGIRGAERAVSFFGSVWAGGFGSREGEDSTSCNYHHGVEVMSRGWFPRRSE